MRRLSPVETIGGGVVLDPEAPSSRGRLDADSLAILGRLESAALAERLVFWVTQSRERGMSEEDLARRAGVEPETVRDALAAPIAARIVHALRRKPDRYVGEAALERAAARAARDLPALIASAGAGVGVSRSTLLQRLLPGADALWQEAIEAALASRGAIVIAGDEARLPGKTELAGPERELSQRIAALYRERGLNPPSPLEASQILSHRPKIVEGLVAYLVKRGELVRLPGGWIIARSAVDDVAARLRGSVKSSLDVGEFKEMFGLTRKLAIPLLEHLDASKVTRRIGDRREVLGSR